MKLKKKTNREDYMLTSGESKLYHIKNMRGESKPLKDEEYINR